MATHIVKQGECLTRIAAAYGFRDYKTIYNDPSNAAFKTKRPDPNIIFPGDVINIPPKAPKVEQAATTMKHVFVVPNPTRVLRIVLEGIDGQKLALTPYELDVEGDVTSGVTDAHGMVEKPIPIHAEKGSIQAKNYIWPLAIAHLNPLDDTADDGVSGIQARLGNLGYNPGPIDGIAGPLTEAAVREFQEDNPPLAVDGICGPKTRAVLVKNYGC
jgi:hypothetical protein